MSRSSLVGMIAGAMATAGAVTATTIGSISTINAGLNGADPLTAIYEGQKSVASEDGMKSVATSMAIGGLAGLAGEWIKNTKAEYNKSITPEQAERGMKPVSDGSSNLKSGLPGESKIGVNVIQDAGGQWHVAGTNTPVSSTYAHTMGNQNPALTNNYRQSSVS